MGKRERDTSGWKTEAAVWEGRGRWMATEADGFGYLRKWHLTSDLNDEKDAALASRKSFPERGQVRGGGGGGELATWGRNSWGVWARRK